MHEFENNITKNEQQIDEEIEEERSSSIYLSINFVLRLRVLNTVLGAFHASCCTTPWHKYSE